jgi:replicative DNA helicase
MVDRNFAEAPLGFATKPHNIDAEQRVLGSLLARNDAFNLIDGIVEAEHFYEPVHRRIFGLMAQEIRAGRVANATTLRTAFRNDQDLREVDGDGYLHRLAHSYEFYVLDIADYARVIRDLACRRAIMTIAERATADAGDMTGQSSDWTPIADEIRKALDALSSGYVDNRVMTTRQMLDALAKKLTEGVKPYPTGIRRLDESFGGGLRPRSLYAVEGQAKRFKTGFLTAVAEGCAKNGARVMFLSLELDPVDMMQRLVGGFANRNYLQLEDQRWAEENVRAVFDYGQTLPNDPLLAEFIPGATEHQVMRSCARAVVEHECQVIAIDYWQRIRKTDERENEAAHLERVANHIADFAAKHGVAIVLASQLNRNDQSLGSGGLERACSWLGKINKVEMPTGVPGVTEAGLWIEVDRNRYGMDGHIGDEDSPAFKIATGPVLREWI